MGFPFLTQGRAGRTDSASTFGAMAFTWGAFLFLGGLPMLLATIYFIIQDPALTEQLTGGADTRSILPLTDLGFFLLVMLQFPIGMVGVWAGTRILLKRSLKTLVTAARRFRFQRLLLGFALWGALLGLYALLLYLKHPGYVKFQPDWQAFWQFLPLVLILVPVQSAFEEIAIRGQLMQITQARTYWRPISSIIFSSFFFALLHSMNPEVETYGWLVMMAQYFAIGLILGTFAVIDGGLEMSIGMHTANNIFSFLLLSYPGSVLKTPSIFIQGHIEPWQDFLAILAMGFILFIVMYGHKPGVLRPLLQREEKPEEDGQEKG